MLSVDHEVVSSNPNLSSSQTFFIVLVIKLVQDKEDGSTKPDLLLELALPAELTDT